MKKTYEKPQIYMERFELAEHIASGCGDMRVNLRDEAACFEAIGGLFAEEMNCRVNASLDEGENYCYYAAHGGLFTS